MNIVTFYENYIKSVTRVFFLFQPKRLITESIGSFTCLGLLRVTGTPVLKSVCASLMTYVSYRLLCLTSNRNRNGSFLIIKSLPSSFLCFLYFVIPYIFHNVLCMSIL